jgi:hypothetical protein
MKNIDKIKKEIAKILSKSPFSNDPHHSEHTLECLLKLKPDADDCLQIAALAHDIERGSQLLDNIVQKNLNISTKEYLRPHEERGAKIIGKILKEYDVDKDDIKKIEGLVAKHEEGGDDDQNLIKDADSISFFENVVADVLSRAKGFGKEMVKEKIDWMYNRITSNKAKEIVRGAYEKAVKDLESL